MQIAGTQVPIEPDAVTLHGGWHRWTVELVVPPSEITPFEGWATWKVALDLRFHVDAARHCGGPPRLLQELVSWTGIWQGEAFLTSLHLVLTGGSPSAWCVMFTGATLLRPLARDG